MTHSMNTFIRIALAALLPLTAQAQAGKPIVAVFAHPDDERVIGPLLSRAYPPGLSSPPHASRKRIVQQLDSACGSFI
jgi:hypothetical protein